MKPLGCRRIERVNVQHDIYSEAGGTARLYNRDDGPGVVVELTVPLVWPEAEAGSG